MTQQNVTIEMPAHVYAALKEVAAFLLPAQASTLVHVPAQADEHYVAAASIIDMNALSTLITEMYATLQQPHSRQLMNEYAAQLDDLYALHETLSENGITSHEISSILDMSYRQARPYPLVLRAPITFSAAN